MKKLWAAMFGFVLLFSLTFATTVFAADSITIFHTNDMHGRLTQGGAVPGINAIGLDVIAEIVAAEENAILVDAGDTFHGTTFVNLAQGFNAVELMNAAGYSLFTPGNHDFNFGIDTLLELESAADFQFISANVYHHGSRAFAPYAIKEIAGVRLGFFGLAHPNTGILTHPNNVVGVVFTDPVAAAADAIEALEGHGVDLIIALVHLGSGLDEDDLAIGLAEAHPAIDIIIDGHSHTTTDMVVGGVLIVQAGAHGSHLGRIDISLDDLSISNRLIERDAAVEEFDGSADVQAVLAEMIDEFIEFTSVVVGYNPVLLLGDTSDRESLRSLEVPIGNLVADALRHASGADIGMTNSGGIRADLPAGDITVGDINSVLPFANYLVVLEITPAVLWDVLEHSVSALPGNGRFMQVSGISFTFDPYQDDGHRVLNILYGGNYLDRNDTSTLLTLATNDFLVAGGDGFTMFGALRRVSEAGNMDEVLLAYMDVADLGALGVEGRINRAVRAIQPIVPLPAEIEEIAEEIVLIEEAEEISFEVVLVEEVEETVVIEVVVEPVPLPAPAPVVVTPEGSGVIVNAYMVNVRVSPSSDADVFFHVARGRVVQILERTPGPMHWYRIQIGNDIGWVFNRYVD